jgi:tetratricopeptide (TPR) repeat protein
MKTSYLHHYSRLTILNLCIVLAGCASIPTTSTNFYPSASPETSKLAMQPSPLASTPGSVQASSCKTVVKDPDGYVNVRSSPKVRSDNIVQRLLNGTVLDVVDENNGWLKIIAPIQGWVAKNRTIQSCEQPKINNQQIDAFFQQGVEKIQQENYEGAIKDLTEVIRLKPDYANAYYQRGVAYFKLALFMFNNFSYNKSEEIELNHQKAFHDFTQVIRFNPNFSEVYYYRGLVNNDIDDFDKLIGLNPNLAEAYYYRAYVRLWNQLSGKVEDLNPRGEFEDLNQAIRLNPDFAEAYFYRATESGGGLTTIPRNEKEKQERQKSLEDYMQAVRINPYFTDSFDYYINHKPILVNSSLNISDKQKEINNLNQIIQKKSKNIDAYYGRAFLYLELGNKQRAIADFNKVIQLNSQDVGAYYWRGFAHYKLRNYQGAIADFNQAIRLSPSFANAYMSRSLAYYDLGDKQQAIKDANEVIRLQPASRIPDDNSKPVSLNAYFIRGRIREDLGDKQGALKDYEIALNNWPGFGPGGGSALQGNPERLYTLGRTLAARGAKKEAIKNLQKAANLFRTQGNTSRYRETQKLISRLQP